MNSIVTKHAIEWEVFWNEKYDLIAMGGSFEVTSSEMVVHWLIFIFFFLIRNFMSFKYFRIQRSGFS